MAKKNEAPAQPPAPPAPEAPALDVDAVLAQLGACATLEEFSRRSDELIAPHAAAAIGDDDLHRLKAGLEAIATRLEAGAVEPRVDGVEPPKPAPLGATTIPVADLEALRAALAGAVDEADALERARAFGVGHPDWSRYSDSTRAAVRNAVEAFIAARWPKPEEPEPEPATPSVTAPGPRRLASTVLFFDVLQGRRREAHAGTLATDLLACCHPSDWAAFQNTPELWGT